MTTDTGNAELIASLQTLSDNYWRRGLPPLEVSELINRAIAALQVQPAPAGDSTRYWGAGPFDEAVQQPTINESLGAELTEDEVNTIYWPVAMPYHRKDKMEMSRLSMLGLRAVIAADRALRVPDGLITTTGISLSLDRYNELIRIENATR